MRSDECLLDLVHHSYCFPGKSAVMFQTHLDCSIIRFTFKIKTHLNVVGRLVKNVLTFKTTQLSRPLSDSSSPRFLQNDNTFKSILNSIMGSNAPCL